MAISLPRSVASWLWGGTPEYVWTWGMERRVAPPAPPAARPPVNVAPPQLLCSAAGKPRAEDGSARPHCTVAARDVAIWGTLQVCLGSSAEDKACPWAAAYRAAWADALTVLRERCPAFAQWAARCLTDEQGPACLQAASEARSLLEAEGWADVPSWELVVQGASPPDRQEGTAEPGEWRHGWQHCASRTRNAFFRDSVLLPGCCPPCRHPIARSCDPKQDHMPQPGSKPSQATPTPPSTPRQCRSRCVGGSDSRSSSPRAGVAIRALLSPAAAAVRMYSATTRSRAPGQASLPDGAQGSPRGRRPGGSCGAPTVASPHHRSGGSTRGPQTPGPRHTTRPSFRL